MRLRRPLGSLVASLGLLGVSCLPGGKLAMTPTSPPPTRGGAPLRPAEETLPPDEGPLRVALATPQGDEVEAPLPTIVFTRSMHRLGDPPGEPAPPATIDPPVEGSWRWIGSRALQFSPRQGFSSSTRYAIEVRPGLRSLDGQTVNEPIRLSFTTPRLKMLDLSLGQARDSVLSISFNQEVDPDVLRKALRLVDEDNKELPFQLDARKPATRFELKPRPRWPEDVTIRARLAPLRGVDGPLGLLAAEERVLRERSVTAVSDLSCDLRHDGDECGDGTSVSFYVPIPLRPDQVRPLVRIEPATPFKLKTRRERWQSGSTFTIDADFKTGVPYKVTVGSSPPRRRGQPGLDQGATLSFHTAKEPPHVSLLVHGTYLRPEWTSELYATMKGVEKASFATVPVGLPEVLASLLDADKGEEVARKQASERKAKEVTNAGEDQEWASTPLFDLMPARPGPLAIEASWSGKDGKGSTRRVIQRSDLAISSRLAHESSLIWVTRLSTGLPAANATVEVHDLQGHQVNATTNLQGVATVDIKPLKDGSEKNDWRGERLVVVAREGDDWVYQPVFAPREPELKGAIFSERDIYRPGEPVFVKGVVRQPSTRGLVPPEAREVKITLSVGGSNPMEVTRPLSEWGTVSHEFALPADAPPRRATLTMSVGGKQISSKSIQIRHVRPASFRVSASLDREHYLPGDPFVCRGQAAYLYGGSMSGMPYRASASLRYARYQVPGLNGFTVGDHERLAASSWSRQGSGPLDSGGSFRLEGSLDDAEATTDSRQLRCEGVITDPGQQVESGTATAWVHPADFYMALGELSWDEAHLDPGKELHPKVLALAPDGTRRSEKVQISLKRYQSTDDRSPVTVASCAATTGADPASCKLRMPASFNERYRLEVSGADSKGRKTVASTLVWSNSRPTPTPTPTPKRPETPQRPPLVTLDQASYRPGDTAHLRIDPPSPFGRGLVIVQREGIFLHRVVSAQDTTVDLPLTAAMAPSVSVGVALMRPQPAEVPYKRIDEPMDHGGARLVVERPPRALQVRVLPSRTEAAPGNTLDVDVNVSDSTGAGVLSEVALYAVDEGMLQLSNYRMPELLERFTFDGQNLVSPFETRSDLGWLERPVRYHGSGTGTGQGFGSGHGRLGGEHVAKEPGLTRSDFRVTPLFAPHLTTDAQGNVRTSFKLPDSLTSYRIMAVALDKGDRFGNAESSVKVSLPMQIRPVVPLAIRAGDRFDVAAVAANNTALPLDATASLAATGFTLAAGQETRALRMAAGASERVTFSVTAGRAGVGRLSFRLAGGDGMNDAAEIPLEVQSPTMLEASALYGSTAASVEESVADLRTVRPDVGWLDLTVSSSPVAGLAPGLEQLVEYPYGCTEQMTSRLVPLLSLRDLASSLGVALPADVDDVSKKTVAKLLQHRHSDGRFGLWASSTPTPWITAYAIWGLAEAHRRGIMIDRAVFEKAADALQEVAASWPSSKGDAANACFALDVLADLPGLDDTVRSHALILARQLAAHPDDAPPFARALLLHALVRLGVAGDELTPPLRSLEASLHLDGAVARVVEPNEYFHEQLDSRVRSSALALRALLAAAPKHPMLKPLALGLIADRGPKGWRTTQEAAWALIALDAFRRAEDTGSTNQEVSVSLGGRSLLASSLQGNVAEQNARVTMAELASAGGGSLLFATRGQGTLHYQARLRYAPTTPPTTPLSAGIEVNRRCHAINADSPHTESEPVSVFAVGNWVRCEIEVVTPSPRRFVAIDAPIPGGFELADPSLQGTPHWVRSRSHGYANQRELRPDRVVYFVDQMAAGAHQWSFVARATTSGEFAMPPARAEEMYSPETYGRTAASSVRITP